jgi:hypothetical protein
MRREGLMIPPGMQVLKPDVSAQKLRIICRRQVHSCRRNIGSDYKPWEPLEHWEPLRALIFRFFSAMASNPNGIAYSSPGLSRKAGYPGIKVRNESPTPAELCRRDAVPPLHNPVGVGCRGGHPTQGSPASRDNLGLWCGIPLGFKIPSEQSLFSVCSVMLSASVVAYSNLKKNAFSRMQKNPEHSSSFRLAQSPGSP